MATPPPPPSIEDRPGHERGAPGRLRSDRDGPGEGGDGSGRGRGQRPAPEIPVLGMWIFLAPVSMLFIAFASAYVIRRGLGGDWVAFDFPAILWGNTGVLLLSSVALEPGRRRAARGESSRTAVAAALLLGIAFAVGQLIVWRQLHEQGRGVGSSAYSSFFYLFTGTHVVHLLGGLVGLVAALAYPQQSLRLSGGRVVRIAAIYWHFLAVLWLAIAGLLVFMR